MDNNLSYGQPKREPAKKAETAKEYFRLGKTVASLEQKKKEIEQATQMNLVQSAMMQQSAMELKDILADIERKQKDLALNQANMMGPGMGGPPPMPPEVGPPMGMPPPLPIDDMGGGPPPEAALGEFGSLPPGQSIPPPDMMGGPPGMGMPPDMGMGYQ